MEPSGESPFEKVWNDVSCIIEVSYIDDTKRVFLKSLLMGGTVSAERAVTNCSGLSVHWGAGDEVKALGLTRLFFWMIFSYYYRGLKNGTAGSVTGLVTVAEAARDFLPVFVDIDEK